MFQALFACHQEALYIQLVYFVCIMSAGCYQGWSGTATVVTASRLAVGPTMLNIMMMQGQQSMNTGDVMNQVLLPNRLIW
jgi:hypothetical protein